MTRRIRARSGLAAALLALTGTASAGVAIEREVTVGRGTWALPGTLTLPDGAGPFPAVVLVHGSGPHDRDETLLANKPFRDLAEGLSTRGIAVLRYEKRTKAHAQKFVTAKDTITVWQETIDDVLEAVALLRATKRIDPKRIYVLGHSLGGMLVPRIGMRDPGLAGLIIMAGNTRPLEDLIVEQVAYLAGLDGSVSPQEAQQIAQMTREAERVKALVDGAKATAGDPGPFGVAPAYWLDLRWYRPAVIAAQLTQPLLILQGGRDYQVTMDDYRGWQQAVCAKPAVKCVVYPGMNHLFVEGEGRSTPADYQIPGHVAPPVIDGIARWIQGHR